MAAVQKPLVVIVGPTASGKTSLAIKLAKRHSGEIICADSRTIYKGLDIGTAKPTIEERQGVPHWGIDIVGPGDVPFTAADFQQYATEKILDIRSRNKTPFLVGGTGLYIDSVIFNYAFGSKADSRARQEYNRMTLSELQDYCAKNNIELPENSQNKRYIIRAIEQGGVNKQKRNEIIANTIVVGIATEKNELRKRIEKRIKKMFKDNVVNETTKIAQMYSQASEPMKSNIYRQVLEGMAAGKTFEQIQEKVAIADWHLAKRQMTWFKRSPYIVWKTTDDAEQYISSYLAKNNTL